MPDVWKVLVEAPFWFPVRIKNYIVLVNKVATGEDGVIVWDTHTLCLAKYLQHHWRLEEMDEFVDVTLSEPHLTADD